MSVYLKPEGMYCTGFENVCVCVCVSWGGGGRVKNCEKLVFQLQ